MSSIILRSVKHSPKYTKIVLKKKKVSELLAIGMMINTGQTLESLVLSGKCKYIMLKTWSPRNMQFSRGHELNYSDRRDHRAAGVLQRDGQVLTKHAESFGSIFSIAYSGYCGSYMQSPAYRKQIRKDQKLRLLLAVQ